jgi:hypothetical protein
MADRVVANGDTANKIGTYQLAIAAKVTRELPPKAFSGYRALLQCLSLAHGYSTSNCESC